VIRRTWLKGLLKKKISGYSVRLWGDKRKPFGRGRGGPIYCSEGRSMGREIIGSGRLAEASFMRIFRKLEGGGHREVGYLL